MAKSDKPAPSAKTAAQAIFDGQRLGLAVGLVEKDTDVMFSLGCQYLNGGHYEKAETIFQTCCTFDHLAGRFWLALGTVRQARKDFQGAVLAYSMVAEIGSNHPIAPICASQCYMAMGFISEAIDALDVAIEWAEMQDDADQWADQIGHIQTDLEHLLNAAQGQEETPSDSSGLHPQNREVQHDVR
ncbi:MAG: hypothetical protein ACR2RE_05145 [Geminicoccaceae bacterium]